MDDEKLIVLVQDKDIIYNKMNPGYKIVDKKKKAWREIANQMGFSEDVCVKRWTSLRDRYVREKRQENLPSGSGSTCKYRWPLMSSLEFLASHVIPRPMRSSINIVDEFSAISPLSPISPSPKSPSPLSQPQKLSNLGLLSISLSPTQYYFNQTSSNGTLPIETPLMDTQLIETQPIESPSIETPPIEKSPIGNSEIEILPKKRRKNINSGEVDFLFSEAVAAFKKVCENNTETDKEKNDPINGFGKMIMGTIATMSPAKQIRAMQRVTTLVMEIKLEPDE